MPEAVSQPRQDKQKWMKRLKISKRTKTVFQRPGPFYEFAQPDRGEEKGRACRGKVFLLSLSIPFPPDKLFINESREKTGRPSKQTCGRRKMATQRLSCVRPGGKVMSGSKIDALKLPPAEFFSTKGAEKKLCFQQIFRRAAQSTPCRTQQQVGSTERLVFERQKFYILLGKAWGNLQWSL